MGIVAHLALFKWVDWRLTITTDHFAEQLALHTPSYIAQRELKDLGSVNLELAANVKLHPEIWQQLLDEAEEVDQQLRATLLANPPNLEKARAVLSERDLNIIDMALRSWSGPMDETLAREIISSPNFDHIQGFSFLASGATPTAQAREIWERYGAELSESELNETCFDVLSAIIAKYKLLSDAELLDLLCNDSKKWSNILLVLAQSIDVYPTLIEMVTNQPQAAKLNTGPNLTDFDSILAKSQHLTPKIAKEILARIIAEKLASTPKPRGWAVTAHSAIWTIAGHPSMPHELRVYALELLVDESKPVGERSITADNFFKPDSEGLLIKERQLLGSNAQHVTAPWSEVTGIQATEVKEFIEMKGEWVYPTLLGNHRVCPYPKEEPSEILTAELVGELSSTLDTIGSEAWSIFIGLLPGWNSSLDDLLFTASSAAKH